MIIQNIFEQRKKEITGTVLFVSWLATYQWKKIIENCNSVGAGADKVVNFWPSVDLIFPIFGKREKGKLYILKKVGRYYNSTFMFLTCFYFAWMGTLRP